MYFSLITMAGEQVETLEQFFTELPALVDLATRHLHSRNLISWNTSLDFLMILLMCSVYSLANVKS